MESLTPNERETYKSKALAKKNIDVNSLTDEDRERVSKSFINHIADQISFLGSVGCTISTLILSPSGNLLISGTEDGQDFIQTNPDVILKFRQYFGEVVGRPSRVPYLKGGFKVVGLPNEVPFRKPYTYGKCQVTAIMAAKDNIHFIVHIE